MIDLGFFFSKNRYPKFLFGRLKKGFKKDIFNFFSEVKGKCSIISNENHIKFQIFFSKIGQDK